MTLSRYLTAQRISLLVLVNLYCNSVLPSSATIPVLSFILSHSIPPVPSNARSRRSPGYGDASFSIEAFENVLQSLASSMPGRTLLDIFLKHMWEVNSFDALHKLFDNIGDLILEPREEEDSDSSSGELQDRVSLSKTSPLGVFVRRARLEFTRLQFDDTMKLWTTFIIYRAPTAQWTKRLTGLASSGVDIIAADLGLKSGDDLYEIAYGHLAQEEEKGAEISVDDLNRLLEFQLDKLQRLGCRVSDDMRKQLGAIIGSSGVVLRQSHTVKFFDAWKAGDYTSAFDNLHRYYDYAMQTGEKIHSQYALLHMAILQADFGCFGEAIAAINETIATARENQDMACLNFSLNWLNHMSKAYPKQMKGVGYMGMLGSERDGLTFLKAKAKEAKMYKLLSSTLLNEARLCLSTGESIPRALEYMYQSSHLNIRENISNYGSHMLLLSTLYSRLGITHLSNVHSELLLHCYAQGCPIDERIRASCRRALSTTRFGRYDEGLQLLGTIDVTTHRSLKFHQYLFLCTGLIKLRRAICRTDWAACEALLSSLRTDSAIDPELSIPLLEAHVDYLIGRGYYTDAFTAIESLSTSSKEKGGDILQRITMLLAKAKLFGKVGKPERGFSSALRAANVSFKARLMPCLWSAVGVLANILNSIQEFDAAVGLLHAIIPQTLENKDYVLTATLYSHIGDSYIGLAGMDDVSTSHGARLRAANVSRAEMNIDRARECYKRTESLDGECEQLMKKAILAKLRGNEKLAEEWAQNYVRVWDEGMEWAMNKEGK